MTTVHDDTPTNQSPTPRRLPRPTPVRLDPDSIVRWREAGPGEGPTLVDAAVPGVDLAAWLAATRDRVDRELVRRGAILFRGFGVATPEAFEAVVRAASGELMEYRERSSPRTPQHNNVYSSTVHPADQEIFPHNENSYASVWPGKIFFCCLTPADDGGDTPLVDVRDVYRRLSLSTRERFERDGVLYVRNFGDGVGLAWHSVFGSSDRREVDAACRAAGYTPEWRGDRLRVRRVGQAVARHPVSGEPIWFNHAAFFHVSTLDREIAEALTAEFDEDDLPNQTFYGDGSPIEPEVLDEIRAAYRAEERRFAWEAGDVLALDNMLVAHGRKPYRGPRRVLVAMTEPQTGAEIR